LLTKSAVAKRKVKKFYIMKFVRADKTKIFHEIKIAIENVGNILRVER
jgi:hypothetical protein